ncbi:MAG: hypothetical protein U9N61_03995, partial [Euryarchaeota archaeon]|nr:hypothetical protein [Euryarchaeota archaeon]
EGKEIMIRIREEQWVAKDKIESSMVRDGTLQLVTVTMINDECYPYKVDEAYLEGVCEALNIPLQQLISAQSGGEDAAGEGDVGREEQAKA